MRWCRGQQAVNSGITYRKVIVHKAQSNPPETTRYIASWKGWEKADKCFFWPTVGSYALPVGDFGLFLSHFMKRMEARYIGIEGKWQFQLLRTRTEKELARYPPSKRNQLRHLKMWGEKWMEFDLRRQDGGIVMDFYCFPISSFPDFPLHEGVSVIGGQAYDFTHGYTCEELMHLAPRPVTQM